jgi:hypothetical protein
MGHDRRRIQPCERRPESAGKARLEALGGAVATGMTEGQIELYLGWAVDEAEQPMADPARIVKPVDQEARRALGAPAERGGDDVHHQRTSLGPEMPRHLRTSSPGRRKHRTVAATVQVSLPQPQFRW